MNGLILAVLVFGADPSPQFVYADPVADCGCGETCGCKPCKCAQPPLGTGRVLFGNGSGSGSAVAVEGGKTLVVTNRHVCPTKGAAWYGYHDKWHKAEVVAVDSRADLSLLVVEGELDTVVIADEEPRRGEKIRQWGFPGRTEPRSAPKVGTAVGCTGEWCGDDGSFVWKSTIVAEPGDSGSGVFNSKGELVAVCWGTSGWDSSCVRLADLRRFVRESAAKLFPRAADRLRKGGLAWEKDYVAGMEKARLAGKATVTVVTADWCQACKKLLADLENDPGLFGDRVLILMDADKYADSASELEVKVYPTVILAEAPKDTGKYGKVERFLPGVTTARKIREALSPRPYPVFPNRNGPSP